MADNDEFAPEQRAELRQRLATPIMDALERWMEATYPKVLPKSRMGQAIDRLCVSIMVKNEELSARW